MYSDWPVGCFESWGFPCNCFVVPFHHQHWQHKQSNHFLFRNTSCGKTIKKTSLAIHLKCAETSNPIFDEFVFPSEISENTWPRQPKKYHEASTRWSKNDVFNDNGRGKSSVKRFIWRFRLAVSSPICSTYLQVKPPASSHPTSHCFTWLQVTQISPSLIFGQTTSFTRSFACTLFFFSNYCPILLDSFSPGLVW